MNFWLYKEAMRVMKLILFVLYFIIITLIISKTVKCIDSNNCWNKRCNFSLLKKELK